MRSYWTISPRSRDFLFVPHRQVFWSCGQPQGFGILAETAQGPRAGNAGWAEGAKASAEPLDGEVLEPNFRPSSKHPPLDIGAVIADALRNAGLLKSG